MNFSSKSSYEEMEDITPLPLHALPNVSQENLVQGSSQRRRHGTLRTSQRSSHFLSRYKSRNQIAFLGTILVQCASVLTMIALIYSAISHVEPVSTVLKHHPQTQTVATYLGLFILAVVFEMLVALDALRQKNIMQVAMVIPFQAAMIVYSSFLPSQLRDAISGSYADTPSVRAHVHGYALAIPIALAIATLILAYLVSRLRSDFGWDVFKQIGADIALKRVYNTYQVLVCMLKYDAFFVVAFSIQFLVLVTGTPTGEFVVTIVALPVLLLTLPLAALAVRYESRVGTGAFLAILLAGMAYFIYKTARIYARSSGDRYAVTKKTLTTFSVICLVMLAITFVTTLLCLFAFGSGLKERLPPPRIPLIASAPRKSDDREKPQQVLELTETRMSID